MAKIRASGNQAKPSTTDNHWMVRQEYGRINIANSLFSPQIKSEVNGLGLNIKANKTGKRPKDKFMDDLLGFRLNNPTAFSHKAFGTERLGRPWQ